jgi:hypothetical protein
MAKHAAVYPATRYSPAALPDLNAREDRERLSAPALKAFFNIMTRWKVRDEDARALIGGVSNGPFYEMKRDPERVLDADRAAPARRAPRRCMRLPPETLVRQFDTHRLVPSQHSPSGDSVLVAIADDDAHLKAIFELDAATNERLLLPGIGVEELVFGVPRASLINAAFCHAHPLGSRFNGPHRGAWYASFELKTAQAEVAFHKAVQLAEIGRFEDTVTCDDYLADFSASFHDLRPSTRSRPPRAGPALRACLDPNSYVVSQELAERLFDNGSLGVVYPSVRPALVSNVRPGKTYRFQWDGAVEPVISLDR